MQFEITAARVRNAANVTSKRDITTKQAEAFLEIFGDEIESAMLNAFQLVIKKHFEK